MENKILLTGGTGNLGKELLELRPDIIAPTHQEMDFTKTNEVADIVSEVKPDIIIHAGAYTDVAESDKKDNSKAFIVNFLGTVNIFQAVVSTSIKLVYISTDYVFDGEKEGGMYKASDKTNPVNHYAYTKRRGEMAVESHINHLIIRTSFCPNEEWKYPVAPDDQWTSRDTVDKIAPQILLASLSDLTGIVHIGTHRKTVYELAKSLRAEVEPISVNDIEAVRLPKDTSLDCSRWEEYKKNL